MTTFTTFYLSRILGKRVVDARGKTIGIVKDLLIPSNHNSSRVVVHGISLKQGDKTVIYNFDYFQVRKVNNKIIVSCTDLIRLSEETVSDGIFLVEVILDKQIVDMNGRKLVRVNDVRMVSIGEITYVVAADIGMEGLLRRIGIAKPLKYLLLMFKVSIPSKFILWEDVEAVDFSNLNIKLSKTYSKLNTLHPSDLADIIEDLGKKSSTEVFSSLDQERAADVLEELEPETQVYIVENLPIEHAADVLEKMPADEAADILDALEDSKAELLLKEMEMDSSDEVRKLLEYEDDMVGSIMSTEMLVFNKTDTVQEVLNRLRESKPEAEEMYSLFVVDDDNKLIATFSLRDIVVSEPEVPISEIMKKSPVHLHDYEEIDEIAEFISKYNLLAIPVVNDAGELQGMVVIDDVVEDLINKRRTNK
ncbi:MAG: CBS domain-containing protein [Paludibacteraceae bacterium]|nr:CBS domain-containing protein [Paludibacteraceae bacterium]